MKKDYEHWFPGDKIVCVNIDSIVHKPSVKNLTIGKIYTIIDFETESPQILNDNNFPTYYDRIRFITLEEFREKQIDKIIG